MLKTVFMAPVAALLMAGTASAGTLQTLSIAEHTRTADEQLAAEVVEVSARRSPVAVIAQDALYGGLAGLAIGAGVSLLDGSNNWGRNLAVGAGAGLLVGGIFGAVDAAANADRAPVGFNNGYRLMSHNF